MILFDAADFLGGLRPVRGKDQIRSQLVDKLKSFLAAYRRSEEFEKAETEMKIQISNVLDIENNSVEELASLVERLRAELDSKATELSSTLNEATAIQASILSCPELQEIDELYGKYKALFAWYDGPLVQAMKQGDHFLIDEISLAEDSVLERLNRCICRSIVVHYVIK